MAWVWIACYDWRGPLGPYSLRSTSGTRGRRRTSHSRSKSRAVGLHGGLATGSANAQVLGLGLKNTPYQTYRPPHRYWFPWMVAGGRSQAAGCGHPNEAWVLKLLVCKRPTIPACATERPLTWRWRRVLPVTLSIRRGRVLLRQQRCQYIFMFFCTKKKG